jgi:hypothetical protein
MRKIHALSSPISLFGMGIGSMEEPLNLIRESTPGAIYERSIE